MCECHVCLVFFGGLVVLMGGVTWPHTSCHFFSSLWSISSCIFVCGMFMLSYARKGGGWGGADDKKEGEF
jgi:hypothetical protein